MRQTMHFSKRSVRKNKIQRELRGTTALLQGISTKVCADPTASFCGE